MTDVRLQKVYFEYNLIYFNISQLHTLRLCTRNTHTHTHTQHQRKVALYVYLQLKKCKVSATTAVKGRRGRTPNAHLLHDPQTGAWAPGSFRSDSASEEGLRVLVVSTTPSPCQRHMHEPLTLLTLMASFISLYFIYFLIFSEKFTHSLDFLYIYI